MFSSLIKRHSGDLAIAVVLIAALVLGTMARQMATANRLAAADEDKPPQLPADTPNPPATSKTAAVTIGRASRAAAGIEVEPVRVLTMQSTVSCNGSADFNQNKYVALAPRAEGILSKIHVDVGASVRAGDVLAVVSSQATGDLKAAYIKSLIHEEHLRWQVEKFKEAVDGIAAKSLFEAQHSLEEQRADTARLKDRLDNFGFSEAEIRDIVEKKDTSPQLAVIAPRAGVIVERQAVEGEPTHPNVRLFVIADLETMWVHLSAYEHQLPGIRLGQRVTFFPDGLPGQRFEGTITWISPAMDSKTRTVRLRAEVSNRAQALRANMFGKGELATAAAHEGLAVPQSAIQSYQGHSIVFVESADKSFEARQVTIGWKQDQLWEISAGLRQGERVATTGSFLLRSNLENPEFGSVE